MRCGMHVSRIRWPTTKSTPRLVNVKAQVTECATQCMMNIASQSGFIHRIVPVISPSFSGWVSSFRYMYSS